MKYYFRYPDGPYAVRTNCNDYDLTPKKPSELFNEGFVIIRLINLLRAVGIFHFYST